jgi:hypothetical protein
MQNQFNAAVERGVQRQIITGEFSDARAGSEVVFDFPRPP